MSVRVMSLFSGYGGLDLGFQMVCPGAETVYVSDIEEGPCRVLAARFPNAPNLGDITRIDWNALDPVDVILGGSPCQDLSQAGQRAGMKPGTRSGLWESMFHAIKTLRPRLVVWENVRGALNAGAFSLMESGTRHLGGRPDGPVLRALGRVLGDLASIGYDAQWTTLRASDVGAAHPRARVFVVAYPAGDSWWLQHGEPRDASYNGCEGRGSEGVPAARETPGWRAPAIDRGRHRTPLTLLPTPLAPDGEKGGPNQKGGKGDLRLPSAALSLLPTPKASDGDWGTPSTSGRPREKSTFLATQISLLLTPTSRDWKDTCIRREPHRPDDIDTLSRALTDFGQYGPAVARWEHVMGRPAPAPSIPSPTTGSPQLSHHFTEWLMGLDGWIGPGRGEEPDSHAISRREKQIDKLTDEILALLEGAGNE